MKGIRKLYFPHLVSPPVGSIGCRRKPLSTLAVNYEKKTPIEHVLLRPGMYVGPTDRVTQHHWLYNSATKSFARTEVTYSPALIKIFDEILVNAADNKERDKKMSYINISASFSEGSDLTVEIVNNGRGIPVEIHEKEQIYVPSLVFGHLLTGSNFDDSSNLLTGGRHGYGAKLTNIFSKYFEVETYDSKRKLLFSQKWRGNMQECEEAVVTKCRLPAEYTKVVFRPDLERFGLSRDVDQATRTKFIEDTLKLYYRRALDVAACVPGINVHFNNDLLPIRSFVDFVSLFPGTAAAVEESSGENKLQPTVFHEVVNEFWEVAVMKSPSGSFESLSFVNCVATHLGGTHVDVVTKQIVRAFQEAFSSKSKQKAVEASRIQNKLMVVVKCRVPNPSFDSQSKDRLTSDISLLGSNCILSDRFLKKVVKNSGILDDILMEIDVRERNRLLRAASTSTNKAISVDVPKLEDAHWAGDPEKFSECTLILTEGDSAKALAISGLEVVGRQRYGVLPLRGKILNARVANTRQVSVNKELINICKAMGLDFQNSYENGIDKSGLRYGKVLLMCDQDDDGSHIKGLIINFFHHFWPNLLKIDGFLQQFITPLVKASPTGSSKKAKSRQDGGVLTFYSLPEYEAWRRDAINKSANSLVAAEDGVVPEGEAKTLSGYVVKYYKGLGTNTAAEGKEYFRNLEKHRKLFYSDGTEFDGIDKAFNKTRTKDRKEWLSTSEVKPSECFVDPGKDAVSFQEFIDKELIRFSYADNERSIPSVIDGLKPSQRKILYACFKKNLNSDMKVGQLAGYVAEQTAYHHGEASLHAAIVKMASDFVGANNVPLLVPSGQFGTRAEGGEDFASPRYIFTRLSPFARALFPADDDSQLEYLEEDGQLVEPKYYVPVLPMLLINGSKGIGTGWSTSIPSFDPMELAEHILDKLRGKDTLHPGKLTPWVRGFQGLTEQKSGISYVTTGVVRKGDKNTLIVSELPVGRWTVDYKEFLLKLCEEGVIKSFTEDHTTETVHFTIIPQRGWLTSLKTSGKSLEEALWLHAPISINNMHAFDQHGKIMQYNFPEDILEEHYDVRRSFYDARKVALTRRFKADEIYCRNRSKFVSAIINKEIDLFGSARSGVTDRALLAQLRERGFATLNEINRELTGKENSANHGADSKSEVSQFSYLLDMPIHSLTEIRSVHLQESAERASSKLEKMLKTTSADLWANDLQDFLKLLRESQQKRN